MTKEEKELIIKDLKTQCKILFHKMDRIIKAKETKSAVVAINRAFKIVQIAIEIRMIQQEIITIASQSSIQFPNGGPLAVHKEDMEKIIPYEYVPEMKYENGEFKNIDSYSHIDDSGKPIEFKKFKTDSASSAE